MNKTIKKAGIITVAIMMLSVNAHGQMVTKEINSDLQLMSSINTYMQTYQDVMNSLTMIQQNYERMQHTLQEAMTWDFSNMQWQGGYNPYTALTNADRTVASLLENVQKSQNALTASTILVNGNRYSLADLAGFGSNGKTIVTFGNDVTQSAESLLRKTAERWAADLTEDEKAYIRANYGLTPESYKIVRDSASLVQDSYQRTVASVMSDMAYQAEKARSEEVSEIFELMLRGGEMTEKEIAQMQGALQGYTIQQLQALTESLQSYISYSVLADQQQKTIEEMKKEEEASQWNFRRDYDSIVW